MSHSSYPVKTKFLPFIYIFSLAEHILNNTSMIKYVVFLNTTVHIHYLNNKFNTELNSVAAFAFFFLVIFFSQQPNSES